MSRFGLNENTRQWRRPALLAAAAAVLAACGSPGGSPAGGVPGPYGSAGSSPVAHPATAGGPVLELRRTSLSVILTDGQGFTLYAFGADRGTTSRCTGACAAAWPLVIIPAAGVTVAGGAEQSLVGAITRAGGARQVTYAGHPLYATPATSFPARSPARVRTRSGPAGTCSRPAGPR
jgi:predicted lipoprotein with Yx(FWY)xxD motif